MTKGQKKAIAYGSWLLTANNIKNTEEEAEEDKVFNVLTILRFQICYFLKAL